MSLSFSILLSFIMGLVERLSREYLFYISVPSFTIVSSLSPQVQYWMINNIFTLSINILHKSSSIYNSSKVVFPPDSSILIILSRVIFEIAWRMAWVANSIAKWTGFWAPYVANIGSTICNHTRNKTKNSYLWPSNRAQKPLNSTSSTYVPWHKA